MKNLSKIFLIPFVFFLLIAWGCSEKEETPIKGVLRCYVDESLYNLIKAERDTFVVLYPQSKIELVSVTAREGIAAVLNGETKLFISSRNLNDEEKTFVDKTKSDVHAFKFCFDAVVPIVRESESTYKIKETDIKDILSGNAKTFKIFVPERNSGVYEYLKEKVRDNKELVNVSIVKNEADVIEKIKSTKRSLGFVGLNSLANIKGVKILEVGKSVKGRDEALYYYPYVAYLVSENYPLLRLTSIFVNDYGGVASGFATFLTSNKGQEIVAKNNLGPATVPVKMVETNRR